jgi:flagellar protein FlaG
MGVIQTGQGPSLVKEQVSLVDSTKKTLESAVDLNVVANALAKSTPKQVEAIASGQITRDTVAKAAEQIQSFVKTMGRDLSFSIDDTTGYHVVKVVNPATGEVIRQLPSPELLKIAQSMSELKNALVSQKA